MKSCTQNLIVCFPPEVLDVRFPSRKTLRTETNVNFVFYLLHSFGSQNFGRFSVINYLCRLTILSTHIDNV
jgi:hypothetical protein